MNPDLIAHYRDALNQIDLIMQAESVYWPWEHIEPMRSMVAAQMTRTGKRARPLFALLCNDLVGGDRRRLCSAAAAAETYHIATLILDDIEDNSNFREGVPTTHVTSGISTAINLAGIIRSLSCHVLARTDALTPAELLALHHRFDTTSTLVPLGQTMDIGRHERWYAGPVAFPYRQMARWKTGELFAFAGWAAGYLAGASASAIDALERLGGDVGVLYQLVDDYFDAPMSDHDGPPPDDLRDAKYTRPVSLLIERLTQAGDHAALTSAYSYLDRAGNPDTQMATLRRLMRESGTDQALRAEIVDLAANLTARVRQLSDRNLAVRRMAQFIGTIAAQAAPRPSRASHAARAAAR